MDQAKSSNSTPSISAPQPKKPRKLKRAILILAGFFVLVFLILSVSYFINYYRIQKAWEPYIKQAEQFEKDYKIYSCQSSEECYGKYVDYLKGGDIEAASKLYSRPEGVEKEKVFLEKLQNENKFDEYVNNLPKWEELKEESQWDENRKRFVHEYVLREDRVEYDEFLQKEYVRPAGVYNDFVIEFFYDHSYKFWKISDV